MLKKEDFMNFNWKKPTSSNLLRADFDVSITKHKTGFCFIFRNHSYQKLGSEHGRIEFTIVNDNVIAFRTSSEGYKLSFSKAKSDNTKSFMVKFSRFTKQEMSIMNTLIGDYQLKYDNTFKLNYIQRGE